MKLKPIALLLLPFLMGCENTETTEGPCDYDKYEFKADIIEITPFQKEGKTLYHVFLEFNNSSLYKEIQDLGKLQNIEIDSLFIDRNNLEVGKRYRGMVSEIKEGNCQPMYISFEHHFD